MALQRQRFVLSFLMMFALGGCGESEQLREAREQNEKFYQAQEEDRNRKTAATLEWYKVMGPIDTAKSALIEKNDPAIQTAIAELKKLGPAVFTTLQSKAVKGEKVDLISAIALLGELGSAAESSLSSLESISQTDSDEEIKSAATAAIKKIKPSTP